MSKLVYVCLRNYRQTTPIVQGLQTLALRLMPDNLSTAMPRIVERDGIVIGIINPTELVEVRDRSISAGYLVDSPGWAQPLSGRPDGAYALFRADDERVEVVSDLLSSRTVWYFKDDDIFIASTSQRAIVTLIGRFDFNGDAIPWMLSSGTLGPQHAWDRRIRRLEGASSLVLDRQTWGLTIDTEVVAFSPTNATDAQHEARIVDVLEHAVGGGSLDTSQWILPLSGGIDCRTLLCLLNDTSALRTVTWGVRASLSQRNNDARVARDLAQYLKLQHRYYETDNSLEPFHAIFNRFLNCGEGRIDHISGYMDGFHIWKSLHEGGVRGIIRGDQVFGRKVVAGAATVRRAAGMPLWSDFSGMPSLAQLGFAAQEIPDLLLKREEETLETWRDRLQQEFRVPVMLAALSDLKLPYVEIASPLLASSVVAEVRKLPDHLRTNKALFRTIAHKLSPPVRFARYAATQPVADVLKSASVVAFFRDELGAARAKSVLSAEFIDLILDNMVIAGSQHQRARYWRRIKRAFAAYLPGRAKKGPPKRAPAKPAADFNRLAFRAVLVSRMHATLKEDAATLVPRQPNEPR